MKIFLVPLAAICLSLGGCDEDPQSSSPKPPHIEMLSSQQATREVVAQFRAWAKIFNGDEYNHSKEPFSGRINLDGEDVVIFDSSATGTLTYAYPVPVQSSVIVVTDAGAMVIRLSPRTIPPRLAPAVPALKRAIRELNLTPGLQRTPGEDLGSWYARILNVMIASMERPLSLNDGCCTGRLMGRVTASGQRDI